MVFIVLDILMLPVSKDCPRLITLSVISILHLFRLSSFCVLCSILHVFLNWLFLIVPSGFSTVQQYGRYLHLHLLGTEHCLCRPLRSGKTIALRWRKRVILICLHYIIIRLFYLNWLLLIILSGRCSRFSSITCYLIMLCQLSITCLSLTINMVSSNDEIVLYTCLPFCRFSFGHPLYCLYFFGLWLLIISLVYSYSSN
jgi:hypothetical protein